MLKEYMIALKKKGIEMLDKYDDEGALEYISNITFEERNNNE